MPLLCRFTTEYDENEDRIRLAGESGFAPPQIAVIWLTRRLLERLIPVLLNWLERSTSGTAHAEYLLSFAQEAAQASLAPEAPVTPAPSTSAWLAYAADISHEDASLYIVFRGTAQEQAAISMEAIALRQWLAILFRLYQQAEWPLGIWPQWIGEARSEATLHSPVLH